MSILMVIGGIVTLIYINRKNIRFDFTFQFKAGDKLAEKSSPVTPNPSVTPAPLLPDTAVLGQSKTVFERNTGNRMDPSVQPNFGTTATDEPVAEPQKESGEDESEGDQRQGDAGLEIDGVHENPHYSLRDQLSTIGEVPPLPDVPLEWAESTDPFRWVPGDDNDIDLEEEVNPDGTRAPGLGPVMAVNPTNETGTPVTRYWQRIEDVHRHAQSLNRLFRRRQRKKDLEVLTTQFLTMLTNLEMRADANVVWLLDDFLAQFTPPNSPTDSAPSESTMPRTAHTLRGDDEFAVFGTWDAPPDEYRNLYVQLRHSAAQLEAADPVSANMTEDNIYS